MSQVTQVERLMRMRQVLMVVVALSACGSNGLNSDAGRAGVQAPDTSSWPDGSYFDAGVRCSSDGGSCWVQLGVCEVRACTYQFPDVGGRCGDAGINVSCICLHDAQGWHPGCTGGCNPDGGLECRVPNCGNVTCQRGCAAYGQCE